MSINDMIELMRGPRNVKTTVSQATDQKGKGKGQIKLNLYGTRNLSLLVLN